VGLKATAAKSFVKSVWNELNRMVLRPPSPLVLEKTEKEGLPMI
jgi:hypothetical protein